MMSKPLTPDQEIQARKMCKEYCENLDEQGIPYDSEMWAHSGKKDLLVAALATIDDLYQQKHDAVREYDAYRLALNMVLKWIWQNVAAVKDAAHAVPQVTEDFWLNEARNVLKDHLKKGN